METAAVLSLGYFEWLERNTHIVYPVLAIVALVAIAAGVLQAWRTDDLKGLEKAEMKREIILNLRRNIYGTTGDEISRATGFDVLVLMQLLEEMQRDGLVTSFTSTQRLQFWRLNGVGN